MTNTKLLRQVIKDSGYRLRFIAEYLGISYQGFSNKINGLYEFKISEISKLCALLKISNELRESIFFGFNVDC